MAISSSAVVQPADALGAGAGAAACACALCAAKRPVLFFWLGEGGACVGQTSKNGWGRPAARWRRHWVIVMH